MFFKDLKPRQVFIFCEDYFTELGPQTICVAIEGTDSNSFMETGNFHCHTVSYTVAAEAKVVLIGLGKIVVDPDDQ